MARFGFKDIKVYLQKKFLYINCGMVCYLHGSNYDSVFPINTGLKVINIDELYTSQGNSAGDTGSFITFEVNVLDTAFNTYQTNFLLLGVEDITSTVLSIISQLLNQALPDIVENSLNSLQEFKKITTDDGTGKGLLQQIITIAENKKIYEKNDSAFSLVNYVFSINQNIDQKKYTSFCGSSSFNGTVGTFFTIKNLSNKNLKCNGIINYYFDYSSSVINKNYYMQDFYLKDNYTHYLFYFTPTTVSVFSLNLFFEVID